MVGKLKTILPIILFVGILIAVGLIVNDASNRLDALSVNDGGIDITYSFAAAYGLDQSMTILGVLLLVFGTVVFFLVVYPVLERRHNVKPART